MLKSASVRLATQITTNPALITLIVEGDIGSCRAAIDAGRLSAERLGAMVSEKVIGRPEPDLALFVNIQQCWKTPASTKSGVVARAVADSGSDANSAHLTPMEATPATELDSDPISVDPPGEVSPRQPEPENASHQSPNTTLVTSPLETLLSYLTSAPNGKRLDQIAQFLNLPEPDVQTLLNFALEQGRLKKIGSRYLLP